MAFLLFNILRSSFMVELSPLLLALSTGFVGLAVVAGLIIYIMSYAVSDERARRIAQAIRVGAMTFLREEYTVIAGVITVVAGALYVLSGYEAAGCFLLGSALSLITGFIGMYAATQANVRTALVAQRSGERSAFRVAFFGGGVMGMAVASFGVIGVGFLLHMYSNLDQLAIILTSFGVGASLVAFFARVGGGIYTKSADVGADLVGKLEANIPEDDPRNPAVIADNVGDCVGDTAGMGADIYESYVTAMISAILLAMQNYPGLPLYHTLPVILSGIGLISSVIGLFSVLWLPGSSASLLRNATYAALAVFLGTTYAYMASYGLDMALFLSIIIGCGTGIIIGLVTEYYTGRGPIRMLAHMSQTGAATNLIYGLSVGMESVVFPMILLAGAIVASFTFGGGVFGVALAAVAMLATVGITMTVDGYGPIADNAGGIAEMAHFGPSVRAITDKLDALGNTTAAIGKGFAIGSAALAALSVFAVFKAEAGLDVLNLVNPLVLAGIFIGAALPFWVSALTMRSVGKAALEMVFEVRRQFQTIPGLMQGTAEPDYKQCIAISTKASLREMILPALVTVAVPVCIKLLVRGIDASYMLGGLLVGATVVGVALALMMANGGGAWDNAKKYIEAGNFGGKGSEAHRAAVVGDTVGDPFKDTSGPALNILIKLLSMVSLLLVSLK
jgi:K(+)-stimulated pyrophosphate-energized sodium pump